LPGRAAGDRIGETDEAAGAGMRRGQRSVWKAPRWKADRAAAILAAIGQGMSPAAVAQRHRVPLQLVLNILDAAKQRERFAREGAESGGRHRDRALEGPHCAPHGGTTGSASDER
jgi:hypothetical protein